MSPPTLTLMKFQKNLLTEASKNLLAGLKNKNGKTDSSPPRSNSKMYSDVNPIEAKPFSEKISILKNVDEYLRKKDSLIKQVTASISGEYQEIEIIKTDSQSFRDIRPLIRFNVSVMVEKNGRRETGSYGTGGRMSYDDYIANNDWKKVCDKAYQQAMINLGKQRCSCWRNESCFRTRLAWNIIARSYRSWTGG